MFHLDLAIKEWRRQMSAAGIKSPDVLNELESHLREEVQNQLRSGVAPEQGFTAAVARVGRAEQLKAEFAKIEGAEKARTRENLRRWSVVAGTAFVYLVLFGTWYLGVRSGTMEVSVLDVALGTGAVVPMILFGWIGRSVAKFLPVINENWIVFLAVVALVFLAALFQIILPAIALSSLVQVQIATLWALSPLLGLGNCVSAWFVRCAELRKKSV